MAENVTVQAPLVLAVETSGRAGSASLAHGPKLIDSIHFTGPMRHSAELFTSIDRLISKAEYTPKDIEQIYISYGPGSFTGIRIAVTLAKTLNFANGTKIVAVDTLDVVRANVMDYLRENKTHIGRIGTIIDAKREQFFIAVFENIEGRWIKTHNDSLMDAAEFVRHFGDPNKPIWLLGEGLVYYAHLFAANGIHLLEKKYWPATAEKVHMLGWEMACRNQFADPMKLAPNYLRGPDAVPKKNL
jgi:tRNA threonylcarbamoyladenosine biosynthesis protein TsaB